MCPVGEALQTRSERWRAARARADVGCERRSSVVRALAALVATVAVTASAGAETSPIRDPHPAANGAWRFQSGLYLWLPAVQGRIATRGLAAAIDVDFDDIFDLMGDGDLFASGGHFEVGYGRLSFFLDAFGGTARPSNELTLGPLQRLSGTADVTTNWVFFEFGPALRILEWPVEEGSAPILVDLLTGGRYMYFYQSITLAGSGGRFGRFAKSTSQWVDPFVGGRFSVPIADDVAVVFRGDIGGFGAGSELAWNLIGGLRFGLPWQPGGARASIHALYKALDFDYESGSREDRVRTRLDFRGPALGLVVDF